MSISGLGGQSLNSSSQIEDSHAFRSSADAWIAGSEEVPKDLDIFDTAVETLIISYNFAPFSDASAVTVAKRIRDFGTPVHVVSQNMSSIRSVDPQLSRIVMPYVTRHFQVSGSPTFASWSGIADFVAEAMIMLSENLRTKKYKRMYSRSMFPASHFLAAHIKALYPEIFWIAEFSDPIRHTVEGLDRQGGAFELDAWANTLAMSVREDSRTELLSNPDVFRWCEILSFESADELWFTNIHQKNTMLSSIDNFTNRGKIGKKSLVFSHPTLPESYYKLGISSIARRASKLYIGYFGEFYSNRGLGDLFRSLSMMNSDDLRNLEVHVYTTSVEVCEKAVGEAGLTGVVIVHKALGFLDFCATACAMDILVVCDVLTGSAYDDNPYLPSKVSDYLGAKAKIMAFVWPGSILSKMENVDKFLIGDTLGGVNYLTKQIQSVLNNENK